MERALRHDRAPETAEQSIDRATAEDTDILTILETDDAFNAIPDSELARSGQDAVDAVRSRDN